MECLLCLDTNTDPLDVIEVDSVQWLEFNIQFVIDKHLWSIEDYITSKSCLCWCCWEELNNFHQFYTRIKETHNDMKILMKTETDPLEEEQMEYGESVDLLLEPEISMGGQRASISVAIKEENEENDPVAYNNEIDSDTHDNQSDMLQEDDDIDDMETSDDSEDNLPLLSKGTTKNTSSINCSSHPEQTSIKDTTTNGNKDKTSEDISADKSDNDFKLSHIPKTNPLEFDNFLKEHFKITCDKCQQTFETFPLLSQHYKKYHEEKGYVICCETKFYHRTLLVDHIHCHLDPEYFKCVHCGKLFTKRDCLQGHLRLHEDRKYACDMCDKKYIKKYMLENHKLRHLPQPEKKLPCNECGKFFANESLLKQHKKGAHLKIYSRVCDVCGKTLPDSSSFKRHMEKHDPNAGPVKCEDCGLIVTSQICLKYHRDLKHPVGGSRDHHCHLCSKVSPTHRALKKHIYEVHEMSYKYKCTLCEKEFKRKNNFQAHMSQHAGTPFCRCPWCPKEFNSSGSMHAHRKKAHPIKWEEELRKKYSGNLPPRFKPPKIKTAAMN